MYPEVQNIDDRKWLFGVTKDLVGVNGIDPARQGIPINPIAASNKTDRGVLIAIDRIPGELWAIGRIPGEPGECHSPLRDPSFSNSNSKT